MKGYINKIIITVIVLLIPVITQVKSYNYEDSIKLTDSYILEFPD